MKMTKDERTFIVGMIIGILITFCPVFIMESECKVFEQYTVDRTVTEFMSDKHMDTWKYEWHAMTKTIVITAFKEDDNYSHVYELRVKDDGGAIYTEWYEEV